MNRDSYSKLKRIYSKLGLNLMTHSPKFLDFLNVLKIIFYLDKFLIYDFLLICIKNKTFEIFETRNLGPLLSFGLI